MCLIVIQAWASLLMLIFLHMAQTLTIALIVVLVAIRLLMPPVPGLIKTGFQQWGTRSTTLLCTIGLALGVVAIFLSKP